MTDMVSRSYGRTDLDEGFEGGRLDTDVWTAAYLPAWSSTREAAATYAVDDDGLRLSIQPDQPLWCPDLHDGAVRVSAVQASRALAQCYGCRSSTGIAMHVTGTPAPARSALRRSVTHLHAPKRRSWRVRGPTRRPRRNQESLGK